MIYFTLVIFNVTSFFSVKMGYLWTFILEFNLLPTKNPGMLYAVGFEILNILRILNFHLPKKTSNFDYALTLK